MRAAESDSWLSRVLTFGPPSGLRSISILASDLDTDIKLVAS